MSWPGSMFLELLFVVLPESRCPLPWLLSMPCPLQLGANLIAMGPMPGHAGFSLLVLTQAATISSPRRVLLLPIHAMHMMNTPNKSSTWTTPTTTQTNPTAIPPTPDWLNGNPASDSMKWNASV